jgi:hypothetical protein
LGTTACLNERYIKYMGTNFYRIPTHEEVENRRASLVKTIEEMPIEPADIERNFKETEPDSWESFSPWDRFTEGLKIHLGKRSSGWRFCWNFHEERYYSNKEELLNFIRSGRVVDEYGMELPVEEFIEMALNWCPDGRIADEEYYQKNPAPRFYSEKPERTIDGLRISNHTDFC